MQSFRVSVSLALGLGLGMVAFAAAGSSPVSSLCRPVPTRPPKPPVSPAVPVQCLVSSRLVDACGTGLLMNEWHEAAVVLACCILKATPRHPTWRVPECCVSEFPSKGTDQYDECFHQVARNGTEFDAQYVSLTYHTAMALVRHECHDIASTVLGSHVLGNVSALNVKVAKVTDDVAEMSTTLNAVDGKVTEMDKKVVAVDQKVVAVDGKVADATKTINNVQTQIAAFETRMLWATWASGAALAWSVVVGPALMPILSALGSFGSLLGYCRRWCESRRGAPGGRRDVSDRARMVDEAMEAGYRAAQLARSGNTSTTARAPAPSARPTTQRAQPSAVWPPAGTLIAVAAASAVVGGIIVAVCLGMHTRVWVTLQEALSLKDAVILILAGVLAYGAWRECCGQPRKA